MRDRGFDFHLLDKYCNNVFAGGFEAQPGERFDLVTCMEVVEHLLDPVPAFRELAGFAPVMIIATELLPARRNRPGEWWYYAPETGQHVSFYTAAALRIIAERLDMRLATNGRNLHVLSKEPVSDALVRMASSSKLRGIAAAAVRLAGRKRRSLTHSDADRFRRSSSSQLQT
jgi:Methyltransferase domain